MIMDFWSNSRHESKIIRLATESVAGGWST